jgi:hypothetical protein
MVPLGWLAAKYANLPADDARSDVEW